MNKKIIFFMLVITSTVAHGMKRSSNIFHNDDATNYALVLFNRDLLPQITTHMCSSHNYKPQSIKADIRALSDTNRFFHDYYAEEKVKQEVIDLCLPHHNSNSKDIARNLGCHAVRAKIERFTKIARKKDKEFSKNDLKDPWYLGVTTTYEYDYNIYQQPLNQPLVYIAIDHWQLQKAITILEKTKNLHFAYGDAQNPLLKIAQHRRHYVNGIIAIIASVSPQTQDLQQLLTIAEKLLQKGIFLDHRATMKQYTPLLYAVEHADKELVRLLLEYGADPSLTRYDAWKKKMVNAFDLEPEKGWLQKIIDEVILRAVLRQGFGGQAGVYS